ncbi:MAG: GyrI-like domain-containing protein [Oscillospiraceae bacterium]
MAELVKFEIKEFPNLILAGKEIRHDNEAQMNGDNPLPAFWDKCFGDGTLTTLEGLGDQVFDDAYVGIMRDWLRGDGMFSYVVGMFLKEGAELPEGFVGYLIPAGPVAVGWIQGNDTMDVCSVAHEFTEKALREQGRTCNNMTWCGEVYGCPRYTEPDENGKIILDYYIPLDKI